MSRVKEEVRKMLDQLPDDVSFEDVQYHIYVRQKLERGLQDLEEGRVLSQEEMERRMAGGAMETVNLGEKLSCFSDYWSPKIVGELNDSYVKLVKFHGEFLWHHHEQEDELFFVIKGTLRMKVRDADRRERELIVREGEFLIVPHGTEHMPIADEEVHVMLLEPKSTLNTGNVTSERTLRELQRL
jgi:mannose-6-phosphate isomerase-like protein (cupin superfamily)